MIHSVTSNTRQRGRPKLVLDCTIVISSPALHDDSCALAKQESSWAAHIYATFISVRCNRSSDTPHVGTEGHPRGRPEQPPIRPAVRRYSRNFPSLGRFEQCRVRRQAIEPAKQGYEKHTRWELAQIDPYLCHSSFSKPVMHSSFISPSARHW
jgi:hypothetical protein